MLLGREAYPRSILPDDHWKALYRANQQFPGERFVNGVRGVANPYGPILVQVDLAALRDARDMANCSAAPVSTVALDLIDSEDERTRRAVHELLARLETAPS